jgi:L-lactate dehydrogenase complex protein LldG
MDFAVWLCYIFAAQTLPATLEGLTMAETATPSLTDAFERAASEAAAVVERVTRDPAAVLAAVERATKGARTIVVADSEFLDPALVAGLRGMPAVIAQPTDDQLATADVGITEAWAAIARTGTVCVALGGLLRATTSLLMPLHVALLPAERIVQRPRDLFDPSRLGGEGLRRNFVCVTGPSATADMGPLVRGVHGPHRLHILVLE